MMLRVCLVALALVVAVQATCLADAISYFATSGVSGSLSGVAPTSVQTAANLPICKSAFTKASDGTYSTCCSADAFNAIKDFGQNYAAAIDAITAESGTLKELANTKVDTSQLPANIRPFIEDLLNLAKDFVKSFFGDYATCLGGYRDYVEGILCALYRDDFFPAIGNITGNVLELKFSQATCDSLVTKCGPVIQDLRTFLISYIEKINAYLAALGAASTTIDPNSLDFLAGVPGADANAQIAVWLCQRRIAGISNVDFISLSSAISEINANVPAGGKRDMTKAAGRLRDVIAKLGKRQSTSTSNVYTTDAAAYNPVAVGSTQSFVGSAASVTVSVAVVALAAIGVMLF